MSDTAKQKCLPFYRCHTIKRRSSLALQAQRREIKADAHEFHQRAAVPLGEGVCAPAVHGGIRALPARIRTPAHRGAGKYCVKRHNVLAHSKNRHVK